MSCWSSSPPGRQMRTKRREIKEAVVVASQLKLLVPSWPIGEKAELTGSESYDPLAVTGRKDMLCPT